jgi:hypothetical protein
MKFLPLVPLLFCASSFGQNYGQTPDRVFKTDIAAEKQAIVGIIKEFDVAIVKKDKPSFMKLFYDGPVSWIGVTSQVSLELRQHQMKSQPKEQQTSVKRTRYSSPEKFIDMIVADKSKAKEIFENVQITTDGNVASVHFDYAFFSDLYKNNWGEEAWQLVKTDDGWKINSVVFSITENQEPRKEHK